MEIENIDERKKAVKDELKKYFKPEFLNRLDDIIIFNPLKKDEIINIVDIMFKQIAKKATMQNINISISSSAKEFIANTGFDPIFGARPLRLALIKHVEDKLSEMILRDEVKEDSKVLFDVENEEIIPKIQ